MPSGPDACDAIHIFEDLAVGPIIATPDNGHPLYPQPLEFLKASLVFSDVNRDKWNTMPN
jgi:hypothetical protein